MDVFGETIREYAYNDAVRDGYLLPVRVISITLDRTSYETSGTSDLVGSARKLLMHETEVIAHTVIRDMARANHSPAGKAIVFVPDLASGAGIVAAIERLQHSEAGSDHGRTAARACLISSQMDSGERESLLTEFRNSDALNALVMTTAWVIGLDLPAVDRCYVTRPISASNCDSVISIAGRVHPGKAEGVVIDFGGNAWSSLGSQ